MGKPEISIVILCYKAGNFARSFHQKVVEILRNNGLDYEIVLVGNFWPNTGDTTPQIVQDLASKEEKTLAVTKEKSQKTHGMGYDMRSGLEAATGENIVVIDGDGQMDPSDIPLLYKKLIEKKLDICKARRVVRADGFYRNFISSIFNNLMLLLFPKIVPNDINGKPKILTRNAYDKLKLVSDDWFVDAEIMIKARWYNLKIGEFETKFHKNPERPSFISLKTNLEFIKNIIIWWIKDLKR